MSEEEKIQLFKYFFFVIRLSKGEGSMSEAARNAIELYGYPEEWFDYIDKI